MPPARPGPPCLVPVEAARDQHDAHLAAEYDLLAAGILQELGEPRAGLLDGTGIN